MDNDRYFISRTIAAKLVVLAAWAGFCLYMLLSGSFKSYLHPSLAWLLIFAVVVLIAMAVALAADIKVKHVHGPSCGCAYHGHHRKWVKVRKGHVHGPGCGHLYIEGRWTIRH